MTPKGTPDPEYPTSNSRKGDRKDKRNLIDVWLKAKPVWSFHISAVSTYVRDKHSQICVSLCFVFQNKRSHYVWHRKEFDEINVKTTDRLMGGYTGVLTNSQTEQVNTHMDVLSLQNTHTLTPCTWHKRLIDR